MAKIVQSNRSYASRSEEPKEFVSDVLLLQRHSRSERFWSCSTWASCSSRSVANSGDVQSRDHKSLKLDDPAIPFSLSIIKTPTGTGDLSRSTYTRSAATRTATFAVRVKSIALLLEPLDTSGSKAAHRPHTHGAGIKTYFGF
jgi:hypothetical protein